WNCTTCYKPDCFCNVSSTGEEEDGNYSLMLSAENGESSVNQTLHFPLNTNYIKIRFKAWGEFDTGAYFKLDIGTETCDLTPSWGVNEDKNITEAQWNVTVCNGTFEGAKSIKISVNDVGDGGSGIDASHVIIDYICPANSSGECITFDTGAPLETLTGRENITPLLYNSTDLWWEIPINFKVGPYTIFANFTGEHYISKENKTYIDVFGIANVSYFNFTPMIEGECEGNLCFTGVDLKLICRVSDKNTSKGIRNFTVYFYNESTYIGSAQTNGTGYAVFIWVNSTNSPGEKEIKCNISNSPDLYYNVTENEMSFNITFSSSTTNGTLNVTPLYGVATNITKSGAALLPFNVTVNNTGEGNMFGISVKVNNITGITGVANVCSYLANGTSCNGTITLNVSREAMLGNNSVNITLEWSNPDPNGPGFQNKTIVVNVTNTTSVNIVNDTVNFSIPYGGKEENIFIVEDFGNAGLENVNFTLWGGNSTVIYDWIRLNGTEINQTNFSIERLQESAVNISIEVPENQTYMGKVFWAYLTASVDNSFCDNSYEKCNDSVLINITVTQQDWTVEPREDSIRVAGIISNTLGEFNLINVTNLKNFTATINVTTKVVNSSGDEKGSEFFKIYLIENGSVSPLPQQVTIQPLSSVYINITYNTSNASENDVDVYTLNISMQNQNSSATPIWINISRVLRVSNFAINIISPTSANPVGPVNVGEIIEIHANATIGKNEHLTENVTWSVWIGGVACPVKSATNVTGKEYDWVINCSAPQIPGNPINNTLLVSGYYTTQNIDFNDTELGAIIYNDTTAPKIWSIEIIPEGHSSATEIDGDPNVHYMLESGNLTIKVNITENNVTSAAWIRVLDPNGGTQEGNLTKIGNYWVYNYTNPGIIGDYEVIVYAKDPVGNLNTTENLPIRFFDVYKPMKFYSNFTYPNGTSINVTLKFYKHGTNWKLHENSSSYFNLTVHERTYDIKAELLGHTVVFLNADLNASARSQFGENGENVTNPFRFDYFPDYTYPQINIMPSKFKNPILGLVVEAPNLTFDSANITINYTESLQAALNIGKSINSQNLEVLVCTDWNYTARRCDGTITNSNYIDVTPSNGLITFSTIPQSAYIVAEGCYNAEGELIDCSGYEETTTTVAEGGGGGGGAAEEEGKGEETTSFTVETNLDATFGDIIVTQGETKEYWLFIRNQLDTYLTPKITLTGEIKNFLTISDANPVIPPKESKRVGAIVSIPPNTKIGTYRGTITIEAGNEKTEIPVSIKVVAKGETLLSLEVDIIKKRIEINEPLKFQVKLRNLGTKKELKPTLTYLIRDGKTDKIVKEVKENVTLERLLAFTRKIDLNGTGLDEGEHVLEVWAEINGNAVSDMESFELVKPFLATTLGVTLLYTLLVLSIIVATIFIRKYYVSWKMEKEAKKRYIFPVRLNAIPQKTENSFWIGTLAGSKIKAWLNPDDLTTHVLIAGATGAGKSVGASVIVEEALEKNIPVIVFDPTAQWTGFVRACSDKNLLKYYPKFGMSPKDARAYKGMIFEMTDPN
ncbi:MAG TPA: DUF87 domain-containing protein, partial [Candidatus Aenigmarchaeota archaeon]|nr:DUF87 domain-containing protein [Candidatus Aenigmarchaeota archaeon]